MKHFRGEMVCCLPSVGNQKTFTQTNYIFGLINSHYKTVKIFKLKRFCANESVDTCNKIHIGNHKYGSLNAWCEMC